MSKDSLYNWEQLINDQIESKLSMKAFCRLNDVPYIRFKNHVYSNRDSKKSVEFVPVIVDEPSVFEITINGYVLSVSSLINDESLKRIIRAIAL